MQEGDLARMMGLSQISDHTGDDEGQPVNLDGLETTRCTGVKTGKKTSTTTETVDNCTAMEADLIPERKQARLARSIDDSTIVQAIRSAMLQLLTITSLEHDQ
jgi:hypothetical protein